MLKGNASSEELKRLLSDWPAGDPCRSFRARGDFRVVDDSNWNGKGFSPLEVRWKRT